MHLGENRSEYSRILIGYLGETFESDALRNMAIKQQ